MKGNLSWNPFLKLYMSWMVAFVCRDTDFLMPFLGLLSQFLSYHSPILQSSYRASCSYHKQSQILQPAQV